MLNKFFFLCKAIIGPPKVSLAGCGNCIHVNVSLPEVDSSPGDHFIHTKYAPTYKVIFKERGGEVGGPPHACVNLT